MDVSEIVAMYRAAKDDYRYRPDIMSEEDERVAKAKKAMSMLPLVDRTIMVLYAELMSYRELGKVLGVSHVTARKAVPPSFLRATLLAELEIERRARDVEILVIDGERRFGNGHLLPAGPLREGPWRAETVDAVVVNGGNLPFEGTPREVFQHGDELERMGLGVPQLTRVFHRLRALGVDIDPSVYTLEQAKGAVLGALAKRGKALEKGVE